MNKYRKLADIAFYTVMKVMEEGKKTHPEDDFISRRESEHLEHARDHLRNYGTNYDREELEHALTRIAIMLIKGDASG